MKFKNFRKNKSELVSDLYRDHYKHILNYLKLRTRNLEDAEDLTAIVFEKAWKKIADFRWQGVSYRSWLFTIARNSLIDYHRKNKKSKQETDIEKTDQAQLESKVDLLAELLEQEEERDLFLAIAGLSQEDQYLIFYKYFEELSNNEIADRLGLTHSNVGTKLHRLRKKLITILKKWEANNDQKN